MAAKANPTPQLPSPRAVKKAMTAVSTETEQEADLSVCSYACACTPLLSFCPGLL